MQLTKKQDPQTYEAIMFCVKARASTREAGWESISKLCVNQGRLIITDGYRAHLTRVTLPDGLYAYSKAKSTITLNLTDSKKFPNVSDVIPKKFKHVLTVNRKDVLRACKQAKVILSPLPQYAGISLIFNGRQLHIKAVNPDIGDMACHVKTSKRIRKKIQIGMCVKYLIDALTGLKGDEITICLIDKTMPLILRNKTQAALIMPMRV